MKVKRLINIVIALGIIAAGTSVCAATQPGRMGCPVGGRAIINCPVTTDSVIREAVMTRLSGLATSPGDFIDVSVIDGMVTLTGQLSDPGLREMAGPFAAGINGVKSVNNKLSLSRMALADQQLAGRVKAALGRWPSILNPQLIFVQAKDGVVTLSGIVQSEDGMSTAELVAEGVPGVTAVYNYLTMSAPYQAY